MEELSKDIIDSWGAFLDYEKNMKRKFSYYNVAYDTKFFTKGHKGTLTKLKNRLIEIIKGNGREVDETIVELMKKYPPKHI